MSLVLTCDSERCGARSTLLFILKARGHTTEERLLTCLDDFRFGGLFHAANDTEVVGAPVKDRTNRSTGKSRSFTIQPNAPASGAVPLISLRSRKLSPQHATQHAVGGSYGRLTIFSALNERIPPPTPQNVFNGENIQRSSVLMIRTERPDVHVSSFWNGSIRWKVFFFFFC